MGGGGGGGGGDGGIQVEGKKKKKKKSRGGGRPSSQTDGESGRPVNVSGCVSGFVDSCASWQITVAEADRPRKNDVIVFPPQTLPGTVRFSHFAGRTYAGAWLTLDKVRLLR